MASKQWTLYIGVTTDLQTRVWQHKTKLHEGFSSKYNCDRLVYFEPFDNIEEAIAREKQLKGWIRAKKLALIKKENPNFCDLAADWFPSEAVEAIMRENVDTRKQP